MSGPFGVTFAPTEDAAAEAKRNQAYGGQRSQAALKVLRLTPPAVYASSAPAANALLQPPALSGGGSPDQAVLSSIVKALLGRDAALPAPPPLTVPSPGQSMQDPGTPRESTVLGGRVADAQPPRTPSITIREDTPAPPIVRAPEGPFPGGRADVTPQTPVARPPGTHVGPFGGGDDEDAFRPGWPSKRPQYRPALQGLT